MPRQGWRKPESGVRLSDHMAIGVLTHTFPPATVDAVIAATGRREQRNRLLPARVMVYYVLAMALFHADAYEEVMRHLVEGLTWMTGWKTHWEVPTKAAIFKSRARLGVEPLRALFRSVVQPLGRPESRGVWYRTWRVMRIAGTTLDVAATPENEQFFGRPATRCGGEPSACPQLRLTALAESGTHAIINAALGPYGQGETKQARELLASLRPEMLCLADRNFFSHALWRDAQQSGAALLWRVNKDLDLPVVQELPDGSHLSRLDVSSYDRDHDRNDAAVRVLEYTWDDPGRPQAEDVYRLITTILDPGAAPAAELAALYRQRRTCSYQKPMAICSRTPPSGP